MLLPDFAVADIGQDFELLCDVDGGPNTFEWEKISVKLFGETSNTLQLADVAVTDAGLYQCTVTNMAGSDSNTTGVHVAPNIITSLQNVTATVSGRR